MIGSKRYRSDVPCQRGHVGARTVRKNRCCECERLRCRKWFADNPKKASAKAKRWRDKTPAAIRSERHRKWVAENHAHRLQWTRERYEKRIEIKRAQARRSQKRNLRKVIARNAIRRALEKGAAGQYTVADIDARFRWQNGRCAECRRKFGPKLPFQIDHIEPLARGGSNWPRNIQLLCGRCNTKKGSKLPFEVAQQLGRLI